MKVGLFISDPLKNCYGWLMVVQMVLSRRLFFFTIFKTSLLVYAHTTVVNSEPSKVFEQYK